MKTYSQFKTELQQLEIVESTTYFVEDLLEEDLFEIIINESYDDSDKILSTLELYSRELIDLSEEELESLIDYYSELNEGLVDGALSLGKGALSLGAAGLSKTASLAKKYGPGVMQKGKEVLGKAAETAKGVFNKAKTGFTSGLQGNKAPAVRGAQGKMTADTSLVTQGANKLGNLLNKAKGSAKPAAAAGVAAGAGYLAGKGSSTNSTVSAKTSPASVPKSAPAKVSPVQKKSVPQTNNTLGMSSAAYNDLKSSASKMKSATSDMASKTGAMKSSMQKFAAKPAAVSGGAPTTAVGSKPPPLDRSTAKKF